MLYIIKMEYKDGVKVRSVESFSNNTIIPVDIFYSENENKRIKPKSLNQDNIAVSRAKVISMLYDNFGKKTKSSSCFSANEMDFFYDAACWLESKEDGYGKHHFLDLYSREELLNPITWSEFAYIWYYILDNEVPVLLSSLKPSVNVCVLKEIDSDQGNKRFNFKLKDYKVGMGIKEYLKDIRKGKRYMPISLYHAFMGFVDLGLVKENELLKELTEKDVIRVITEMKY